MISGCLKAAAASVLAVGVLAGGAGVAQARPFTQENNPGETTLAAVPAGCGDVDGVSTEFIRVTARHDAPSTDEFQLVIKGEPVGTFDGFVDQSFPTGEGPLRVDLLAAEGSGKSVSLDVPDVCGQDSGGLTVTVNGQRVDVSRPGEIRVEQPGIVSILISWL